MEYQSFKPIVELFESTIRDTVKDTVRSELEQHHSLLQQQQNLPPTELLSRKQAAKFLGVSLPTLNLWSKEGIVNGYRIASRIRYKKSELETSLKQMKTQGRVK